MNRFIIKTPKLVHWLFPKRVWAFSRSQPNVYLTFDDGPIPEVTPWILEQLRKYGARATFFCIGDNVVKHPEIAQQILNEGHTIGNHTYHHKNGWQTRFKEYITDFEQFNSELKKSNIVHPTYKIKNQQASFPPNSQSKYLFRPPFGKMTAQQANAILEKGHDIIMWDVLSGDFNQHISEEKCLDNVLKNIKQGSIVVFHDSLKAEKNLRYVLPKVLEHIKDKSWKCLCIT